VRFGLGDAFDPHASSFVRQLSGPFEKPPPRRSEG
jgi:hypothetical protein